MPDPGGRSGDFICVYVVSGILLAATLAGGAFLVLYFALPESPDTAWFPFAGTALVGVPWLFWIATWITAVTYRAASSPRKPARPGGGDRAVVPEAAVAVGDEGAVAVDSPGGGRRVRFGGATVMGGSREFTAVVGGGWSLEEAEGQPREDGGRGAAEVTLVSSVCNGEGSSLTSCESDLPLFTVK